MAVQTLRNPGSFEAQQGFQYYRIVRYYPKEMRSKKPTPPRKQKEERKWFWQRGKDSENTQTEHTPPVHSWSSVTVLYFDEQVISLPQYTNLMSGDEMATLIDSLVSDGYEHVALYQGKKKEVLIYQRALQSRPLDMIPEYELDDSIKRFNLPGDFEIVNGHEYYQIERLYPLEGLNWSQIHETFFDADNRGKTKKTLAMTPENMAHKVQLIQADGYQLLAIVREFVVNTGYRETLFWGREYIGNPLNINEQQPQPAGTKVKPIPETPFSLEADTDYCSIRLQIERGDFNAWITYFDATAHQSQELISNPQQLQNFEQKLIIDGWQKVDGNLEHHTSMSQSGASYYRRSK